MYITEKDLDGLRIGDFTCFVDSMSGAAEWKNSFIDTVIYATPNFETEGEVPVDIVTDGEYESIMVLYLNGSKEEQLKMYLGVIEMIIKVHFQ